MDGTLGLHTLSRYPHSGFFSPLPQRSGGKDWGARGHGLHLPLINGNFNKSSHLLKAYKVSGLHPHLIFIRNLENKYYYPSFSNAESGVQRAKGLPQVTRPLHGGVGLERGLADAELHTFVGGLLLVEH